MIDSFFLNHIKKTLIIAFAIILFPLTSSANTWYIFFGQVYGCSNSKTVAAINPVLKSPYTIMMLPGYNSTKTIRFDKNHINIIKTEGYNQSIFGFERYKYYFIYSKNKAACQKFVGKYGKEYKPWISKHAKPYPGPNIRR